MSSETVYISTSQSSSTELAIHGNDYISKPPATVETIAGGVFEAQGSSSFY
jgi:hypothetical protein